MEQKDLQHHHQKTTTINETHCSQNLPIHTRPIIPDSKKFAGIIAPKPQSQPTILQTTIQRKNYQTITSNLHQSNKQQSIQNSPNTVDQQRRIRLNSHRKQIQTNRRRRRAHATEDETHRSQQLHRLPKRPNSRAPSFPATSPTPAAETSGRGERRRRTAEVLYGAPGAGGAGCEQKRLSAFFGSPGYWTYSLSTRICREGGWVIIVKSRGVIIILEKNKGWQIGIHY